MSGQFIRVSEGFWNIRGSFKIAGVIDVGTQASLVRLTSGRAARGSSCSICHACTAS